MSLSVPLVSVILLDHSLLTRQQNYFSNDAHMSSEIGPGRGKIQRRGEEMGETNTGGRRGEGSSGLAGGEEKKIDGENGKYKGFGNAS